MKFEVSPGLLYKGVQIKFKNLPDGWQEGRGKLLLGKLVPVKVLVPSVVLDIVSTILQLTVTLGYISDE